MLKLKKLSFIFALLFSLTLTAQQHSIAFTYVHTDKNIYSPGETVWFKAYFPTTGDIVNETLLVRLANSRKNIVIAREFAAYDLRAHGQLALPDTLSPGDYTLFAYGNTTGVYANDVYSQSIQVIDNTEGMPIASVQVAQGSVLAPGNPVNLEFSLVRGGRPVTDVKGRFSLIAEGADKQPEDQKLKTGPNGTATATFTYPEIEVYAHVSVQGYFSLDNKKIPFSLTLPSQKKDIRLTVTPEGGMAVIGVKNSIVIQTEDTSGQEVTGVSVNLTEDGVVVQTGQTNAQGMAIFQHLLKDVVYSITASLPSEGYTANLPLKIEEQGLSMVLEPGGKLMVRNSGAMQTTRLELWCEGHLLFEKELTIKANATQPIALPPSAVKKIVSAALFNNQGQLVNERLFYSGTQNGYTVTVDFENQHIKPHQNITATISVTDIEGNPVRANLSGAVVHRSLIDKSRYKTITASRYSAIAGTETLQQVLALGPDVANSYLAGKKWRTNLLMPFDTISPIKPGIEGSIVPLKKKKKSLDQMVMMAPETPGVIELNPNGSFYIEPGRLLAHEGQDCYLFFNDGELGTHNLNISDPGKDFDAQWLARTTIALPVYKLQQQTATLPEIPGAYKLEELVIGRNYKGLNDANYQKWLREYPSNCGDWVCEYNILNCPNHSFGRKPEIGARYFYHGQEILYTQCIYGSKEPQKVVLLKTITLPEDFPETKFDDEYDLKYYTTLAWLPNIDTDENGRATMQFTASDLEGKFLIVLQGLSFENNDAIYGEAEVEISAGK